MHLIYTHACIDMYNTYTNLGEIWTRFAHMYNTYVIRVYIYVWMYGIIVYTLVLVHILG